MMKILWFLLPLFFTTQCCYAQAETDTTVENSLIWQITGNGLKTPSYLFGTFHAFCKDEIMLTDNLKDKISAAEKIFFESEIRKTDGIEISNINKNNFVYDYTIKYLIGEGNFSKAAAIINSYKPVAEDTLNKLHIGIFTFLVYQAYVGCDIGSYDYAIAKFVINSGKKINTLDDISTAFNQNQIPMREFFDKGLPQFYKQYWDNMAYDLWVYKKSIELYKEEKITEMYLYSAYKANGQARAAKERVLDERNKNWLPIINRWIRKKNCFFAFGAAHLAGPKGIIALLRKKGYTVTPVSIR